MRRLFICVARWVRQSFAVPYRAQLSRPHGTPALFSSLHCKKLNTRDQI
jgi:hypothetical protein